MERELILSPENGLESFGAGGHEFNDFALAESVQPQQHVVFTVNMSNRPLIKYNIPRLIPPSNTSSLRSHKSVPNHDNSASNSGIKKTTFLPAIDGSMSSMNEDIQDTLNTVLQPKQWKDPTEDCNWVQEASSTPATRIDVFNLQRQLDDELEAYNAKEFGLCPVRRQLYNDAFDELIRQVTVNCSERGLMLARIRDELRLTLNTYQCLYESAVGYGLRKAIGAEQMREDTDVNMHILQQQHKQYSNKIDELQEKLVEEERMHNDERVLIETKLGQENSDLKKTNNNLKAMLEKLLALDDQEEDWMNLDKYIPTEDQQADNSSLRERTN